MIRIYLNEKELDYEIVQELPWKRKKIFSEKHWISDIPTLVEKDRSILEGWYAILEHTEQSYRSKNMLLGISSKDKAEIRRLMALFNVIFFSEVTFQIVHEKVFKKYMDGKAPDSSSIRNGIQNLKKYFDYVVWLLDRRNWLAGQEFSMADISLAAQVSCIDYLGSIVWEHFPVVKEWYVRIKSRPSFRGLLSDHIPNIPPPTYYSELDF